MLGVARVQIPENNLDNQQSVRKEDGSSKTVEPQDLLGCNLLALVDGFTPVEDNAVLLETRFEEESVFVVPTDVTGSTNLTLLSLFFGVTATILSLGLLMLGQVVVVDELWEHIPVIHTIEIDMVTLVVEIESSEMSSDELDKETGSSNGLQPKAAGSEIVLHDIASNLRMEYFPKRRCSERDRIRSRIMIKKIDKRLYKRRLMRNLLKFFGGREYWEDLRLLE
ncbi:hypothetical protein Tco_1310150 [Tanacetum coccineum]